MLVTQFGNEAFADVLRREIASADRIDVATAWVRASGMALLWGPLEAFLRRGGSLLAIVGLDGDNTSREGLEALLALDGDVELWVRHNEAGPIFHPKLYAFRDEAQSRIYVGSNNLTAAGLVGNEEVSALLRSDRGSELDRSLEEAMARLATVDDGLSRRLDRALLEALVARGYIFDEARLRGKSGRAGSGRAAAERLFGSRRAVTRRAAGVIPVTMRSTVPSAGKPEAGWRRVFVKVLLARGTQAQLPVPVAREVRRRLGYGLTDGPIRAIMRDTGEIKEINPTFARRNPDAANTYKLEAFAPARDIVIKLEFVGDEVLIELFDTQGPAGRAIDAYIDAGLRTDPPATMPARGSVDAFLAGGGASTLYRYD
ncbi:hypothetical protein ASE67_06865 [Sphingomonas sp. Leaf23]|uniref:phospholipase D family protein n=1 Tax=Sphingomonas sp. Leaf23 TaxID=1735689 RepID=UPI0006FBE38A|nr:phospholipase D family protein [Sphingomonas sp. Leaf23]KQM87425.1 hypothetical protein ASE67_06865 [Sphingomonas sp. Leaf23]